MAPNGSRPATAPGSNWAELQKTLLPDTPQLSSKQKKSKLRKDFYKQETASRKPQIGGLAQYASRGDVAGPSTPIPIVSPDARAPELVNLLPLPASAAADPAQHRLLEELRVMCAGEAVLNEAKRAPGNYIAIDCEMVGLGPEGRESGLARVSIVNYHGHILLDTFVQPREAVTDYRTWISGIRPRDLQGAPTFDQVQKQVSELVDGRTVIGHSVENDFKALFLSHPAPLLRDTQTCKALREVAKTKKPGLKKLAQLELGIAIQSGAHSSVTDARATMALYRLHKTEWEKSFQGIMNSWLKLKDKDKGKRKRKREEEDEESANPGGGRKGISSNIGMVITHKDGTKEVRRGKKGYISEATPKTSGNWWQEAAK